MTQAFNLAQLANAVDTSGRLNVGTNATGTLPVSNGGTGATSLAANNVILGNGTSAVQAVAPGASGNFLRSNGTTWQSVAVAVGSGTVTSVATGNGLQGGTITTSGTLSLAAPGFNTVGSYTLGTSFLNGNTMVAGSNYSAGTGFSQISAPGWDLSAGSIGINTSPNNLSGTWRYMNATMSTGSNTVSTFVRVT